MTQEIYQSFTNLEKYTSYFSNLINNRYSFHYIMFDQTWPSTALGFNCVGGDAMTCAPTMVIFEGVNAHIFFNGRYCYTCQRDNTSFVEDLHNRNLKPYDKAEKSYGAFEDENLVQIRKQR